MWCWRGRESVCGVVGVVDGVAAAVAVAVDAAATVAAAVAVTIVGDISILGGGCGEGPRTNPCVCVSGVRWFSGDGEGRDDPRHLF